MARYSVLRLMMFFGFLCALWLLGLRDVWLLAISALGSMVVSYFVLKGPRAEFSARIARHVDERATRAERARADEIDEDTEADENPEADQNAQVDEDTEADEGAAADEESSRT
ncbi:MAG TPA: DUF4229 domain-containing protein [Dermatophilaceae bacterium]|jgi:hypothetical protein